MSWWNNPVIKTSENSREARRQKLEADRQSRTHKRELYKSQLEAARKAEEEAEQAFQNLLEIDPDIFAKEDEVSIADSEISELLADDPAIMEDFEIENGTDGKEALTKLGSVKCDFSK